MKHYVYKVTNSVNSKFYIGVHSSKDPTTDGYFGSGQLIKNAIKKYGLEVFTKEILYIAETRTEAFDKEREIVNDELLNDELCYNLILGGSGDNFGVKKALVKKRKPMSNETKEKIRLKQKGVLRGKMSQEARIKMSVAKKGKTPLNMTPPFKKETIEKINVTKRENIKSGKTIPKHRGISRSTEVKNKISETLKGNIPWNVGLKMNEDFKEKCRNVPREFKAKHKELVEKLKTISMTYDEFRNFVKENYDLGLKPYSILKKLNTTIISVTPIKSIFKELKDDNNQNARTS